MWGGHYEQQQVKKGLPSQKSRSSESARWGWTRRDETGRLLEQVVVVTASAERTLASSS